MGKPRIAVPGCRGAKGEQRGGIHFQHSQSVHSALLNKAPSCSEVTSWGIPTQDHFHKPQRHRDRNNLMSDTNVEICQQTTDKLTNEITICSWLWELMWLRDRSKRQRKLWMLSSLNTRAGHEFSVAEPLNPSALMHFTFWLQTQLKCLDQMPHLVFLLSHCDP